MTRLIRMITTATKKIRLGKSVAFKGSCSVLDRG
jgi:hypothetical protein